MFLSFDPQCIEDKEHGREELASTASLSLKDAAPFFTAATHENFQSAFNSFVTAFPKQAVQISNNRPDGVGPGEMIAFFLFDDVTLGGRCSAIDININGAPFAEMKGGQHTKKTHTLDDFKITKDGDPAVALILKDLEYFNYTHSHLTGHDLPYWKHGSIGRGALDLWGAIDLLQVQQHWEHACKRYQRVLVPIDSNGAVWDLDGNTALCHLVDHDAVTKITEIVYNGAKIFIDNTRGTLRQIIARWVDQVFIDYIGNKQIALINNDTMQMLFFGQLTKEMVGLYRIHRNQPWARIYLEN